MFGCPVWLMECWRSVHKYGQMLVSLGIYCFCISSLNTALAFLLWYVNVLPLYKRSCCESCFILLTVLHIEIVQGIDNHLHSNHGCRLWWTVSGKVPFNLICFIWNTFYRKDCKLCILNKREFWDLFQSNTPIIHLLQSGGRNALLFREHDRQEAMMG